MRRVSRRWLSLRAVLVLRLRMVVLEVERCLSRRQLRRGRTQRRKVAIRLRCVPGVAVAVRVSIFDLKYSLLKHRLSQRQSPGSTDRPTLSTQPSHMLNIQQANLEHTRKRFELSLLTIYTCGMMILNLMLRSNDASMLMHNTRKSSASSIQRPSSLPLPPRIKRLFRIDALTPTPFGN